MLGACNHAQYNKASWFTFFELPFGSSSFSNSYSMNLGKRVFLLSCINWIMEKTCLELLLTGRRERPSYSISINIAVNQIFRRNTLSQPILTQFYALERDEIT